MSTREFVDVLAGIFIEDGINEKRATEIRGLRETDGGRHVRSGLISADASRQISNRERQIIATAIGEYDYETFLAEMNYARGIAGARKDKWIDCILQIYGNDVMIPGQDNPTRYPNSFACKIVLGELRLLAGLPYF